MRLSQTASMVPARQATRAGHVETAAFASPCRAPPHEGGDWEIGNAGAVGSAKLCVAARSALEAPGRARIENLSGRRALLPIYHGWKHKVAGASPRMMGDLLNLIGTRLDLRAQAWPITCRGQRKPETWSVRA